MCVCARSSLRFLIPSHYSTHILAQFDPESCAAASLSAAAPRRVAPRRAAPRRPAVSCALPVAQEEAALFLPTAAVGPAGTALNRFRAILKSGLMHNAHCCSSVLSSLTHRGSHGGSGGAASADDAFSFA